MTPLQQAVFERIQQFRFDDSPDGQCDFVQQLASSNNWSTDYAARVVEEYRRFVLLAMTTGHSATPSDQVDQAWHQHLADTKSYWSRFCGDTLGEKLHHNPTHGGHAEGLKFREQYEQTLRDYRSTFGEPPPADIWPEAYVRFTTPTGTMPSTDNESNIGLSICGLIAGLCMGWALMLNPWDMVGKEFLILYLLLFISVYICMLIVRHRLRLPKGDPGDEVLKLSPEEAAYLAGDRSATNVLNAATASLVASGALKIDTEKRSLELAGPEPTNPTPVQRAILQRLRQSSPVPMTAIPQDPEVQNELRKTHDSLAERGLLVSRELGWTIVAVCLIAMLAVIGLGVAKWFIGYGRSKPIGLLTIFLVISAIMTWATFVSLPFRSRRGDRGVDRLMYEYAKYRQGVSCSDTSDGQTSFVPVYLGVGLYGPDSLEGGPCAHMKSSLVSPASSGGESYWVGCGGDGGGDGGGGGGCGGCGGGD